MCFAPVLDFQDSDKEKNGKSLAIKPSRFLTATINYLNFQNQLSLLAKFQIPKIRS